MNILREVRKIGKKSMLTRISLLIVFSVILIINTYAWFGAQKEIKITGLEGDVTSWDVYYYVNSDTNEVLDQTATFTIEELYPGMPNREDVVHIHNIGKASTNIQYELLSVKVFGQEVLGELQTSGKIQTSGNTTKIFSEDTDYPFEVSYTYDKSKLTGTYAQDGSNPNGEATFKFNVNWTYEGNGTDEENLAKDVLDTKFGKDAYAYYQTVGNDPSKAIEIQIRITSSMIHPSLENQGG